MRLTEEVRELYIFCLSIHKWQDVRFLDTFAITLCMLLHKASLKELEKETQLMVLPPYEETVILPPTKSETQNGHSLDTRFMDERAWLVQKCAGIVRNADAAEDLAQETLLEA